MIKIEKDVKLSLTNLIGMSYKTPLLKSVFFMNQVTQTNFDTKGGEVGGWQARKKEPSWWILVKSGRMRGNFDNTVTDTQAEIFNNTPYFNAHQAGYAPRNLPKRAMLFVSEKRHAEITEIFSQYINEQAN